MSSWKYLLVSLLILNLKGIVGKTLNCLFDGWGICNFVSQELDSADVNVTFDVLNLTPESSAGVYFTVFDSSSIYYIPASIFTHFTNLQTLIMSSSNVHEIRNDTFQFATSQFGGLYLDHNKISALGPDTFKGATGLRTIHLSSNQISSIDGTVFRDLPYLEYLDLSNNSLVTLDPATFSSNWDLREIYLNHNKINALDGHMFDGIGNSIILDLSKNECVDDVLTGYPENNFATKLAVCNAKYYKPKICHRIIRG
jgi:hypothetical protein